jgi:hypothetical protein
VAEFAGQRTGPSWFNRNIRQAMSPKYRASMGRGMGMLASEEGTAAAMRMTKFMRGLGTVGTAVGAPLSVLAEDAINKPVRERTAIQQSKAISDLNPFIRLKGASMNSLDKNAGVPGAGALKNFQFKDFAMMAALASGIGIGMQELVRNLRIAGDRAAYNVQTKHNWNKLIQAYPELEKDPNNYEIFRGISEIAPSVARHPSMTINLIRSAQNYATTGMDPGTLRTLADIQSAITDTELKELNKGISPGTASMIPMPTYQLRTDMNRP